MITNQWILYMSYICTHFGTCYHATCTSSARLELSGAPQDMTRTFRPRSEHLCSRRWHQRLLRPGFNVVSVRKVHVRPWGMGSNMVPSGVIKHGTLRCHQTWPGHPPMTPEDQKVGMVRGDLLGTWDNHQAYNVRPPATIAFSW